MFAYVCNICIYNKQILLYNYIVRTSKEELGSGATEQFILQQFILPYYSNLRSDRFFPHSPLE